MMVPHTIYRHNLDAYTVQVLRDAGVHVYDPPYVSAPPKAECAPAKPMRKQPWFRQFEKRARS